MKWVNENKTYNKTQESKNLETPSIKQINGVQVQYNQALYLKVKSEDSISDEFILQIDTGAGSTLIKFESLTKQSQDQINRSEILVSWY